MYIPEIELKPQSDIKRFQEEKLHELLQYLSEILHIINVFSKYIRLILLK